jgi:hypothetical protein
MVNCIYFVLCKDTGNIKIGYTTNLKRRMRSLKSVYGPLEFLGIVRGDVDTERIIHNIMAPYRIKGELYENDKALSAFVDDYAIIPWWALKEIPPYLGVRVNG